VGGIGGLRVVATALVTVLLALGASAPAMAAPDASLSVGFAPGSPAPPVLNLPYSYAIDARSTGDVALARLVVTDTLPVEMTISSATTGNYVGLADFAAGEGVRVTYEKNTAPGVFTLWGSSPNTATNTTLTAPPPGLGAGEYITRVRWEFGEAAPGMRPTTAPRLAGRVTNPDNTGGPVAAGDPIQNCATLSATGVTTKSACTSFTLIAGPTIGLQAAHSTSRGTPVNASATLAGGAPTGTLTFRVFAASDTTCAAPLLAGDVTVTGVGTYAGPDFPAATAGAYKWVASYSGDSSHVAATTGCNNPTGALTVVAPPSLSASFDPVAIAVGGATTLTFTITNPSANTVALTAVALEDTLPAGLAVASPNGLSGSCGAGSITADPGSQSVSLTGGTIAAGSSCSFSVNVTASAAGEVSDTTGTVASANGGSGNTATASLTVVAPPPTPVPPIPVPPATTPVPTPPVAPTLPRTAQELAVACAFGNLVLSAEQRSRGRVRFRGAGDPTDAGRQVVIRALPGRTVAARATVRTDGSFTAMGPLPRRRILHKTRYLAELDARRSRPRRLTRRLTAQLTQTAGAVVIRGHATPPLGKPIRRVVITRLTTCAGGYEVVARVMPSRHGRFRVTLTRASTGPALYRAQTRVRTKAGGMIPTRSLVLRAG
jgi:uncharacterized repeat protein (TIGR01451 family)